MNIQRAVAEEHKADDREKLDYSKTHAFWEKRAEKFPEGILMPVMLHDDIPPVAFYRDVTEKKHFFRRVKVSAEMEVLDLGGGTGRWAFDLAGKVKKVTVVDFSKKLLACAARQARERGLDNIEFVEADVTRFTSGRQYDLILISGVLMYINDEDMETIRGNCAAMLKPGGRLVLREGVSWKGKMVQPDVYAPELKSQYHVVWRSPEEYARIFEPDFNLQYANDAFPFMAALIVFRLFLKDEALSRGAPARWLTRLLILQSFIDQVLLCRPLMWLYHSWIRRHALAITARFYIFSKRPREASFCFAGRDVAHYASSRETPFFLFSEEQIKENYSRFIDGFAGYIKPSVYYSVKTNYESAVLLTMRKMGLGAEIASQLDFFLALKAGFKPSDMVLDGMVKETGLLEEAVGKGVRVINIDAIEEIGRIQAIAGKTRTRVNIGARLYLERAGGDWRNFIVDRGQKRFGMSIDELVCNAGKLNTPLVVLTTLMAHTTKSFPVPRDYSYMLEKMFLCAGILKSKGVIIEEFNLGGGIPEPTEERPEALKEFAGHILLAYKELSSRHRFAPRLSFELGKSLVGNAGILVGRVVGVRKGWIITDISRSNYGFAFPFRRRRVLMANRYALPSSWRGGICSNTLEKFDIIQKKINLPKAACSDIIVVLNAGAYSLPLSTQFTRPRCPVYFVTAENKDMLIRRKETPQDVIANQEWNGA